MQYLEDDHLKLLLHQEWLVKIDGKKSIPYLMKFYASAMDQCCCIMITDTKQVWGEVLSSKGVARRWRECNPGQSPALDLSDNDEEDWRSQTLELLTSAHSLGGIIDLEFEIEEKARNADLAFVLGSDDFKWRWETYSLGPRVSADVLSQHLILPLISVTHLAFSSADPVSELSAADLEKAIDKVGRTARRSVDTHVRHAVTKPRVATALRRMAAVYNFANANEYPPVHNEVSVPELKLPVLKQSVPAPTAHKAPPPAEGSHRPASQAPPRSQQNEPAPATPASPQVLPDSPAPAPAEDDDSATEPEAEPDDPAPAAAPRQATARPSPSPPPDASGSGTAPPSRQASPRPQAHAAAAGSDDDEAPPARPSKKTKRVQSSSDDESEGARRRPAQRKTASRGAKQPLKRGGRRF